MFKPHQVHRRAFQGQLQALAFQRYVQLCGAVLVGGKAGVLIVVLMFVMGGVSGRQGQQGERQGK
jgi:hypothetical protein